MARASGVAVGDVDGPDHEKARALVEWAKWFKREQAGVSSCKGPLLGVTYGMTIDTDMEIYFWYCWWCPLFLILRLFENLQLPFLFALIRAPRC